MKRASIALGGVAAIGLGALLVGGIGQDNPVQAADHGDSPATSANTAQQDLTDLYSWTWDDNGTDALALVMNVASDSLATDTFAAGTQFVFHIESTDGTTSETNQVVCSFRAATDIDCYVGNSASFVRVQGDATGATGIADASGIKIFAGPRNDPFFFNQQGLLGTFGAVQSVCSAADCSNLTFNVDYTDCPDIGGALAGQLQGCLTSQCDDFAGGANTAAVDDFATTNVLSLVVSAPLSLMNGGGDTLRVWASTHVAP